MDALEPTSARDAARARGRGETRGCRDWRRGDGEGEGVVDAYSGRDARVDVRDRAAAAEAAAAAASVANGLSRDPGAARQMLRLGLNRRSGAWAEITFDDLVEALLCDGAERTLARVTPGVGEKGAARALHLAAQALLLTSQSRAERARGEGGGGRHRRGERRREDRRRRRRRRDGNARAYSPSRSPRRRSPIRSGRGGTTSRARTSESLHRDAHVRSAHVGV